MGISIGTVSEKSVFVVGVPRSGTSLIYNILVRLKEFSGEEEIEWNTETSIFKKYVRHMRNFFEPGTWPFWYEYFAGNFVYFEKFLMESCRSFLVNAALARKSKRILEKTPNHIEHMDFIVKVFPDARFVHIYRHPVDIYASMRKRAIITPPGKDPWLRVSAGEFAQSYNRKILFAYEQGERIIHVKYEDITRDPACMMEMICNFVGAEFDKSCISGSMPKKEVGKFPYRSNVPVRNSGDLGILSVDEITTIENLCAGTIHRLAYVRYSVEQE